MCNQRACATCVQQALVMHACVRDPTIHHVFQISSASAFQEAHAVVAAYCVLQALVVQAGVRDDMMYMFLILAQSTFLTHVVVAVSCVQRARPSALALLNGRLARLTESCIDWQPWFPIWGYHEQALHIVSTHACLALPLSHFIQQAAVCFMQPFVHALLVSVCHSGINCPFWYHFVILVSVLHSVIVLPFW